MLPDASARPTILLAVTGLSPQVVTETIWGLLHLPEPVVPQAVRVLTTREGADTAADVLPREIAALGREFDVALPCPTITTMTRRDGTPLDDLLTSDDNVAAADAITAAIRSATADPATALHVSIAGGRKTLGCLAGMALSLFGRPQDRLSHVLVSPAFQSRPDFYFPPRVPRLLPSDSGPPLSTARAQVMLADIPFVRLRGVWRDDAIAGYAAAVRNAQAALAPPVLRLDPARGQVHCGGITLRLTPTLLGTLLWLAELRQRNAGPIRAQTADHRAWIGCVARCSPGSTHRAVEDARRVTKGGMEPHTLAEKVSRLNRALRQALGPESGPYEVRRAGRRPNTGYLLTLPPDAITIVPAEDPSP